MSTDEFADFISIADAAEQYGVTQQYWYGEVSKKHIAGYKLPGRRGTFLRKSDLKEFWQPKQINPDEKKDTTA